MSTRLLSVNDLQDMGIARTMVYNLFNREDFPTVQIGKRKFVREEKFNEWLQMMEEKPLEEKRADHIS